jgi:hypothetical protein
MYRCWDCLVWGKREASEGLEMNGAVERGGN